VLKIRIRTNLAARRKRRKRLLLLLILLLLLLLLALLLLLLLMLLMLLLDELLWLAEHRRRETPRGASDTARGVKEHPGGGVPLPAQAARVRGVAAPPVPPPVIGAVKAPLKRVPLRHDARLAEGFDFGFFFFFFFFFLLQGIFVQKARNCMRCSRKKSKNNTYHSIHLIFFSFLFRPFSKITPRENKSC
jgi:hypothetical protein